MLHLVLHVVVPGLVAVVLFRPEWRWAWLVMVLTMVVDADHLLADPVYDPGRCSIGFHPLHSALAIALYAALMLPRKTRLFGIGLLVHMALDGLDCVT